MKIRPNDLLILDKKNKVVHFDRNLKGQCKFNMSSEKQTSYADLLDYHESRGYKRCPYCFNEVYY